MIKKPNTFAELLALWANPTELSDALRIPYVTAQVMRHRVSIGDQHWARIIECARDKGVELTTDDLLAMRFRRREERRAEKAA